MGAATEYVTSVEGAWAAWALALAALALALGRKLAAGRWPRPGEVARDEEGLSYTLNYALTVPLYALLACAAFETTLLLVAKIGTRYAAYAAARSAVVWLSARPEAVRDARVRQAAFTALAPFCRSGRRDLAAGLPSPEAVKQAAEYALAYELVSRRSAERPDPLRRPYRRRQVASDHLFKQYLVASARATVEVQVDTARPDGDVTATLTYRAPILIPGAARFLNVHRWPYEYRIESRATLPNEAPVSHNRSLNIDYRSSR